MRAQRNVLPLYIVEKTGGTIKSSSTKSFIRFTNNRMSVIGETTLIQDMKCKITFKENVSPI